MGFGNLGRAFGKALGEYPARVGSSALSASLTGATAGGIFGAAHGTLTGEGTFRGLARGTIQGGVLGGFAGAGWGAMTRGGPMNLAEGMQGFTQNVGRAWRGDPLRWTTGLGGRAVPGGGTIPGPGGRPIQGVTHRGAGMRGSRFRKVQADPVIPSNRPDAVVANQTALNNQRMVQNQQATKRESLQEMAARSPIPIRQRTDDITGPLRFTNWRDELRFYRGAVFD